MELELTTGIVIMIWFAGLGGMLYTAGVLFEVYHGAVEEWENYKYQKQVDRNLKRIKQYEELRKEI